MSKKLSHSSHPAASAAESDLVKLTREFESLRSQLAANDEAINDHRNKQQEEANNFHSWHFQHEQVIAHLHRQRRTLEAQFENCRELMRPLIQIDIASNDCSQPLNRFR